MRIIFLNIVFLVLLACLPGCGCDDSIGGSPSTYKEWKIYNPNGTWDQYKQTYNNYWGHCPDSNQPHLSKFNLKENHRNIVINFYNIFNGKTVDTATIDENHKLKILLK
jgi:hypothetical protein